MAIRSLPLLSIQLAISGAADWQADWVICKDLEEVIFTVTRTAVAATAGELFLLGTDDTAETPVTFPNASMAWWPSVATVDASAGKNVIAVQCPMPFHTIKYVRGAGGGANQFKMRANGR